MLRSTQRASGAPNRGISSPSFHGSGSSRTGHLQGWKAGGERPQPFQRIAGMLRPLSNKWTRISHTSVSPELLEFYGLQLHHLTPASILHIAGFVALVSCSWASSPILRCGRDCFASYPVLTRGRYIKWAEPKYGASLRPDIYPAPRRRRPKTGLRNGFI